MLLGELALGLVAGIFSGMLGIGGGQVLVPGMTLLFGVDQRLAQGISLAFIVPTALSGAITHYRQGTGQPRAAMLLIPGALVGGVIGAGLAQWLPIPVLRLAFGLFLLYMGLRMVFPGIYGRVWRALTRAAS
jgi:uncharacterized membrane protein YfcA